MMPTQNFIEEMFNRFSQNFIVSERFQVHEHLSPEERDGCGGCMGIELTDTRVIRFFTTELQSFARRVADDLHERALAGATIAELIDYASSLSGVEDPPSGPIRGG